MAAIRVYLLTCRRPQLLRRALGSLLAQTCTDWVCELHNDAPEDEGPPRALAELAPGDARFTYHRHERQWGAVASFSHFYRAGPEPYASVLEDDNWWEPRLLGTLRAALEAEPAAALCWANMRVWREDDDGSWSDTRSTVWPTGESPRVFDWPVLLQAFDALHSHGAMLFRRPGDGGGAVPTGTPLAIIEAVHERAMPGRLVLVPEALANFALTRGTARSGDRALWAEGQLLLSASFLEEVPLSAAAWDELFARSRRAKPRQTGILLLLALAGVRRREILSRAAPGDVARFAYGFVGNLRTNLRALGFRRAHGELWAWLRARTAARTAEARAHGWVELGAGSLFSKQPSEPAQP
jgi:hypothetical protein